MHKSLGVRVAVFALMLVIARPAAADDTKPEWKFALHGFLGGSLYGQDAVLGPSPGQQPMWAVGSPKSNSFMLGGDIRQNRLNFSLAGPTVLGATPRGVAEIDFFGGNSSGGFGDVSVFPRMRVSYAELAWENTTLRIGQEYSLTAGFNTLQGPVTAGAMSFPVSVGHIAFPITYAAGTIGWRYPGIFLYHRVPMGDNKLEFAFEVARAAWANPANPGVGTGTVTVPAMGGGKLPVTVTNPFFTTGTDLGSASGIPQLEARATYAMGDTLGVMLTGHYSSVNPAGFGGDPTGACSPTNAAACPNKTVWAVAGAVRVNLAPVVFQGGGYVGQNTSPLLGEIVQFPNLGANDVGEWGGWAQAGFYFTKELGVFATVGTEHPNYDDARAAGLNNLSNTVAQGMVRYLVGGYAFALEVTHWHTRTATPAPAPNNPDTAIDGDQFMFSSYYFF